MSAFQAQVIASALDQGALNLVKYNQQQPSGGLPAAAAFITGGAAYLALAPSMKEVGLANSNLSWNLISSILGLMAGVYIWKEEISDRAKLGIGLGLLSLWLIDSER